MKKILLISTCILFFSLNLYSRDLNSLKLNLNGEFQQGGLLFGEVHPHSSLVYNNMDIFIDDEGRFVLGLGRDEKKIITLTVSNGSKKSTYNYFIKRRNYDIQSINGINNKFIYPDEKNIHKSKLDAKAVLSARNILSNQSDFFSGFIWPVKGPITGVYGSQRIFNGEPRRPHYGVDIAAPLGSDVVAPASGTVTFAEHDLFFSGGTMIIDHGHGLSSTFLHLNDFVATINQKVSQGELIAKVGDTGRVTGPHLDWRMNWTLNGTSVRIDPELIVIPGENLDFGN